MTQNEKLHDNMDFRPLIIMINLSETTNFIQCNQEKTLKEAQSSQRDRRCLNEEATNGDKTRQLNMK